MAIRPKEELNMTSTVAWAVAGGGAGLLLAAIGLIIYVLNFVKGTYKEVKEANNKTEVAYAAVKDVNERMMKLSAEHVKLLDVLKVKDEELNRERESRKAVERQSQELLKTLAKIDNPVAISELINLELKRLSEMSKASNLSSATPADSH